MSALARHFQSMGKRVSGYDKTPSEITQKLIDEGIEIGFEDSPSIIPKETDLVIYTPAVPKSTRIFEFVVERKIPFFKRSEILGILVKPKRTIAVAGTHGKTTISSLIAHIFKTAGVRITAFIGGISSNYDTNYINDENAQWAIVEADEFDRSFLHIQPDIALISSLDADHLDIYGTKNAMIDSFRKFAQGIRPNGTLVVKSGIESILEFPGKTQTYSIYSPADLFCSRLEVDGGLQKATLEGAVQANNFSVGLPGRHNVENAIGAALVASIAGIETDTIVKGISTFSGVKRRFEKCYEDQYTTYIDDYAHHPEEIRACLEACKELYPTKKITVIFQPHLFSRTRDLAHGFARALELADKLIMMDIYPARELPLPGITSGWLMDKVRINDKVLASRQDVLNKINDENHELLLTLGAGDIDRSVSEIIQKLKTKQR